MNLIDKHYKNFDVYLSDLDLQQTELTMQPVQSMKVNHVPLQTVFNRAASHLLTQGERCTSPDDSKECLYYAKETGLSCPVGSLISKEYYSEAIEGEGAKSLAVQLALLASGTVSGKIYSIGSTDNHLVVKVEDDTLKMLDRMQFMHDQADPDIWPTELEMIAKRFDLNYDVLKEFE